MHSAVVIARPSNATAPTVMWRRRCDWQAPATFTHLFRGLRPIAAMRIGGGIVGCNSTLAPEVAVGDEAVIGENCILLANVTIGRGALIGSQCIIAEGAHVGDNVRVGANCYIGIGTIIPEGSIVPPNSWVTGYV